MDLEKISPLKIILSFPIKELLETNLIILSLNHNLLYILIYLNIFVIYFFHLSLSNFARI